MNNNGIEIASVVDTSITIFLLAWVIGFFWFVNRRSRSILQTWAKKNGFEILHFRQSCENPFGLSSKGQTVYSVKVRDRAGNERSGLVRCGSFFSGVLM